MKDIFRILKEEILNEYNNKQHLVYRAMRTPESPKIYDGMFFSETEEYAKTIGGQYVEQFIITCNKPLNFFRYNEEIDKLGIETPYDGPLFTIGERLIRDNYNQMVTYVYNQNKELGMKIYNELKTCDSIYGPDSGFPDSKVWYVKTASQIEII